MRQENVVSKSEISQKFTKLPPRHLIPLELNMLNSTKDGFYMIKEKADGFLVDFITSDVSPEIKEYTDHVVKAEFIEELDLYLIFDIQIDNMSIIDRYDYLRSLHPSTKDLPSIRDQKVID